MKLESYLGPAGIWSLNSILYAVEPVIFLINHLWTIHGIKPRFLNAAHGPFHHLATALFFSKPYSHQSLGNPTLQSPTFTGLCTHLTFSCTILLSLLVNCYISFILSSCVTIFVKSSHHPSQCRGRGFVGTQFKVVLFISGEVESPWASLDWTLPWLYLLQHSYSWNARLTKVEVMRPSHPTPAHMRHQEVTLFP